jgi:hypothetical protein
MAPTMYAYMNKRINFLKSDRNAKQILFEVGSSWRGEDKDRGNGGVNMVEICYMRI